MADQRSGSGRSDRARAKGGGRGRPHQPGAEPDGRGGDYPGPEGGERRPIHAAGRAETLPKWIRDEVVRVTPKDRRDATLNLLAEAAADYADSRFGAARQRLLAAKDLSPRAATIRELLGLGAYRMGKWQEALAELRTFRRLAGETTHLPVEMDSLRALGRRDDVEKTWERFRELGGSPTTEAEMRVVYGSFLLDQGNLREAWEVVRPARLTATPPEPELRRWFVAGRVAARLGDTATARRILGAIEKADIAFPGLPQLTEEIGAAEAGHAR